MHVYKRDKICWQDNALHIARQNNRKKKNPKDGEGDRVRRLPLSPYEEGPKAIALNEVIDSQYQQPEDYRRMAAIIQVQCKVREHVKVG